MKEYSSILLPPGSERPTVLKYDDMKYYIVAFGAQPDDKALRRYFLHPDGFWRTTAPSDARERTGFFDTSLAAHAMVHEKTIY